MYKKIKATKNNSLKKASLISTLAVLASCAVFMDSERFMPSEVTSTSALSLIDNFNSNKFWGRHFNNFNRNKYLGWGNRFNDKPKIPVPFDAETAEYENYTNFCKTWKSFLSSSAHFISILDLEYLCAKFAAKYHTYSNVIKAVAKYVSEQEKYKNLLKAYDRISRAMESPSDYGVVCGAIKDFTSMIIDYLMLLYQTIQQISTVISLSRLDTKDQADQAVKNKSLSDKIGLPSDVIEAIQAAEIVSDANLRKAAKRLGENATKLAILGQNDDEYIKENPYAALRGVEGRDRLETKSTRLLEGIDGKQSALSNCACAYSFLLYIIQSVNAVVENLMVYSAAENLAKVFYTSMLKMEKTVDISTVAKYGENKQAQLDAICGDDKFAGHLLLLLAVSGRDFIGSAGGKKSSSILEEAKYNFANALSDGVLDERVEVSRGYSCFIDVIDGLKNAFDPEEYKGVALERLLMDQLGENVTKDILDLFDTYRGNGVDELLGDVKAGRYDNLIASDALRRGQDAKDMKDALDANLTRSSALLGDGSDLGAVFKDKGGRIGTTFISEINAPSEFVSQYLKFYAMPLTLKTIGFLGAYTNMFNSRNPSEFWRTNEISKVFTSSSFGDAIKSALSKLERYNNTRLDAVDIVKKIKKDAKKEEGKGEIESSFVLGDAVSSIVILNGQNEVQENKKGGFQVVPYFNSAQTNFGVKVLGLPADKKISVVVCPKTKPVGQDTAALNKDLPIFEARNGVIDIAMSDYDIFSERGFYELHVRLVEEKEGKTEYKFLNKFKCYVMPGGKGPGILKFIGHEVQKDGVSKQSDFIGTENPFTILCVDGTVAYVYPVSKDFKMTAEKASTFFSIMIKKGTEPNLEEGILGACYNEKLGAIIALTRPGVKEPTECHMYEKKLASGNFLGKVTADPNTSAGIPSSQGKRDGLARLLGSQLATEGIEYKKMKFKVEIPYGLIHKSDKNVSVQIYDDKDDRYIGTVDASFDFDSTDSKSNSYMWGTTNETNKFTVVMPCPVSGKFKLKINQLNSSALNELQEQYGNISSSSSLVSKDTLDAEKLKEREDKNDKLYTVRFDLER